MLLNPLREEMEDIVDPLLGVFRHLEVDGILPDLARTVLMLNVGCLASGYRILKPAHLLAICSWLLDVIERKGYVLMHARRRPCSGMS